MMDNSLKIGKYITLKLSENKEIKKLGITDGSKIWPIVANTNTKYPYIVYQRTSLFPEYTKDGVMYNKVSVELKIVTDNYIKSLDIANIVRQIFEKKQYISDEFNVKNCEIEDVSEDYIEDAYVQTINFVFTLT